MGGMSSLTGGGGMSSSSSASGRSGDAGSGSGSVNVGGFNVPAMPGGMPAQTWVMLAGIGVIGLYLMTKRRR